MADEDHSKVEEHILKRFELQEYKGKGAYGIVWKAWDRKTKQTVALKKVIWRAHQILRSSTPSKMPLTPKEHTAKLST
jgi:hypothetical protein